MCVIHKVGIDIFGCSNSISKLRSMFSPGKNGNISFGNKQH